MVSYDQLAVWTHANESSILPALAELVDFGLIVVMKGKRAAGSVTKAPNLYRLTFVPDHEGAAPTNEWRRWEPSLKAGDDAWRAASERARMAAHDARERIKGGRQLIRSDDEIAEAVATAEAVLKKTGKDKKIRRPGNGQTRAALTNVNSSR